MAEMTCAKRRYGDEWHCGRCRTRWDVSDTEPPICEAEQAAAPAPVTLTERLRKLLVRLEEEGVMLSIRQDLDDMIEEVKLLDDERRRSKANIKGGAGTNISPLRPRGA